MKIIDESLRDALLNAISPLPTIDGGIAIILTTAGPPPTITPLSTGDVVVEGDKVRLALFAGNSSVEQLGGSCTLLVPSERGALRVFLQPVASRAAGPLAVIEGTIFDLKPSLEPPWSLRLEFYPTMEEGRAAFVDYWIRVRAWLEQGASGSGPEPPTVVSTQ